MHNYCYLHQTITTIFRTLNFSTGDWNVFLRDIFILVRSNPRLCHASFRCNLYISRVFSTLFTLLSPPSSRPVRADTYGTLEITGLSPLFWKLLRPSVFRVHQSPFSFYTIPLSISCYSKSVCKVGISSRSSRINALVIRFTCLTYSFGDTRVIITNLFL